MDHFAREHVHRFLSYDLSDHSRDREHADVIARRVKADVERVHGCLAGGEDCVALAALVAEALGLTHAPSYASAMGITKGLVMKALLGEYWPPHQPNTYHYASPTVRVTSPEDLMHAVKQVKARWKKRGWAEGEQVLITLRSKSKVKWIAKWLGSRCQN